MATTTTTTDTTDTLNSLMRGEISAIETYRQAEAKFQGEPESVSLQRLNHDHQQSASELRQHIHTHGAEASDSSGAWGTFAQLVEGGAKLFGKKAALEALVQGEKHGLNSYESALRDRSLPGECQALIRDTLLPRCRQHIESLNELMARQ